MDSEKLARYQKMAEQTFSAQLSSYTEHSKWILGALLTLNGGSLISIGQSFSISPSVLNSLAPITFICGALVAIFSGILARKRTMESADAFLRFLMASTDQERLKALESGARRDKWLSKITDGAAYTSVIAFLVGAVFTWIAMVPKP